MGDGGKYTPGKPLAGPPRSGTVVTARVGEISIGRVMFKGETGSVYALYETVDKQPVVDASGAPVNGSAGKPLEVSCPKFGRGAKIKDIPFARAGEPVAKSMTRCCKRGTKAIMMVEIKKGERQFVEGKLTVTPRLLDRAGTPISSSLKPVTVKFKGDQIAKSFFTPDVDLGAVPNQLGLFQLELTFTAKPTGPTTFAFTETKSTQFVACTMDAPLEPDKDAATVASDTVSGTSHRLGKLMTFVPKATTDVEDILWRAYVGMSNATPPNFFNKLGVEITHNGDLKYKTGKPFPLTEQWLMWVANAGSPPWNRAACAGYVQLLKTMAATVGINVRRTLCLPVTNQMPPPTVTAAKPKPLPLSAITVETPMVIASGGLDVMPALQKATLVGPDGKPYVAHPALMEPHETGEFFEACDVTPGGKYLPGGFSTKRIEQTGVANWTKGTSGKKVTGDWTKAERGFDSAIDVVRWWSSTKTRSGFQRFMCWVHLEDGELKYCWDVDGSVYLADEYEQIRDLGKQLPAP